MVSKYVSFILSGILMFCAFQVAAATEAQLNSIQRVGQLNGVALQCRYLNDARRMKLSLVAVLPKRRQLGQVFDDATNESFLSFIQNGSACPEAQQFTLQVDAAVAELNQAFVKP